MSELEHGGRLDRAIAKHGGLRKQWLDLSTGINPTSWPIPDLPQPLWHRLPERADLTAAKEAARDAYLVPDHAGIAVGPGTQMLIQLLPLLFPKQSVAIVGQTYEEHAKCWRRHGHEVFVTDGLASAEATARIVVVVNPDNPTSRVRDAERIASLAKRLAAKGGLLVVDEAFADVTPKASVADIAGRDGLLVLRSLGKFFGLAGARVGFALTTLALAERLEDQLGPWAVGAPSLHVATKALGDRVWIKRMQRILAQRRRELEHALADGGLEVVGGTDLFVLAQHANAAAKNERLLEHRILARTFETQPTWLRFGIPGGQRALARLQAALG